MIDASKVGEFGGNAMLLGATGYWEVIRLHSGSYLAVTSRRVRQDGIQVEFKHLRTRDQGE